MVYKVESALREYRTSFPVNIRPRIIGNTRVYIAMSNAQAIAETRLRVCLPELPQSYRIYDELDNILLVDAKRFVSKHYKEYKLEKETAKRYLKLWYFNEIDYRYDAYINNEVEGNFVYFIGLRF